MIWTLLLKPFDRRVVLSAPVLVVFVGLLTIAVLIYEMSTGRSGQAPLTYVINSEVEDTMEVVTQMTLPEAVTSDINTLIEASKVDGLRLEILRLIPVFQSSEDSLQRMILSYSGEELARLERYEEALAVLETLGQDERLLHGSSFAFARTLNGLGLKERALKAYAVHTEAFPNHQAGSINHGLLLAEMDRDEEALAVLKHAAAITSGSRRGKALSLYGSSLVALGRYPEAVAAFERSIEYRPGSAAAWRNLGIARSRSPDIVPTTIDEAFRKATALSPGNLTTHWEWANALFGSGRFDEALPIYRAAHKLAPDRYDVQLLRALNLLASERPAATRRVLKDLGQRKRTSSQKKQLTLLTAIAGGPRKNLRRALKAVGKGDLTGREAYLAALGNLKLGETAEAEVHIQALSASSPFRLPAEFQKGRLLYRNSDFEGAKRIFSELGDAAPLSPLIRLYQGRALLKTTDGSEALEVLERAYQLQPDSRRITLEYTRQLSAQGDEALTLKILSDFIALKPRDTSILAEVAATYEKSGANTSAIKSYGQILKIDPDNSEIGMKLTNLQMTEGSFDEALRSVDGIIERFSGHIDARMARMEILMGLGRRDEALAELDRVLRLDPDNGPANEAFSLTHGTPPV